MAIRRGYVFTHHLRERFLQRTNKKYSHLQTCKAKECIICDQLKDEIKKEVEANRRTIDAEISRRLEASDENKAYLNNTGFMEWYYEKYGYDKRFEFLVHEEILFVVVLERSRKVIVTCVPSKTHFAGRCHHSKTKFSKVLTKEKKEEKLMHDEVEP